MNKKFGIFITFIFCDSVNHDNIVVHLARYKSLKYALLATHLKGEFLYIFYTKPSGSSLSPSYLSPHFISILFLFLFASPLHFSSFFFSPLLSVVPFSFLFSFFYVSCFFCICFPFNNPPYSFLHFLRSLSVYVPYRCIFVLCTSSFFLLPAFFYSQRLTVASHIARIFCIFCPHTAVCVGEDPQGISSLVLFPSSLFSFST